MAKGFDLAKLNPQQREAVLTLHGPVLVLAGAGTGKTRTLTARIAHMFDEGVPAERILAVTFTNKAANEMRERVRGMVARGAGAKLTLCTFHSLCVRILRQSIDRLGYKRNFSIHTESEQRALIRRILVRRGGRDDKADPGSIIARISMARNKGQTLREEDDELLVAVARDYEAEKKAMNAVDFDDLLVLAVQVVREHADVCAHWRDRFHFILVDEFQDTNRLQMDLLRHLVGPGRNICVVGDDDQSIYGWRGAEIENLLSFERYFENPKVIRLEENYRSTTPILHTANSIIRHNLRRREKKLWSRLPGEDKVRLVALPGDADEADFVVGEIQRASFIARRPWEDFAVLFRTNQQSRLFEEALRAQRIPYRMIGGQSFFDRREVKDVLAYLTVFVQPEDDIQLLRILNTPPRGLSTATAQLLVEKSQALGIPVWQTLGHEDFRIVLGARARQAVESFLALVRKYSQAVLDDYAAATSACLDEIGYDDFLRRASKTPEEAAGRAESVASLVGDLHRHRQAHRASGLRGFLDDVALNGDRDDDSDDLSKQNGVSLITLHAAKGLEFPDVYLVGVEEGILPHKRALLDGSRDEERRLFYVGVTRAMRRLTLSFCAQRKKWGAFTPCLPSTFLRELDTTYLDEVDYEEERNRPSTDEERAADIEYFKAMLDQME